MCVQSQTPDFLRRKVVGSVRVVEETDTDFNPLLLDVLLKKPSLGSRAKARFLQVLSGVLPTSGWLKSKGLISDGSCPPPL